MVPKDKINFERSSFVGQPEDIKVNNVDINLSAKSKPKQEKVKVILKKPLPTKTKIVKKDILSPTNSNNSHVNAWKDYSSASDSSEESPRKKEPEVPTFFSQESNPIITLNSISSVEKDEKLVLNPVSLDIKKDDLPQIP